jgi:hypothetical protein
MRRELIFLLISTALNTSHQWSKIAGLAFAGLLKLSTGKLKDADSLSSIQIILELFNINIRGSLV